MPRFNRCTRLDATLSAVLLLIVMGPSVAALIGLVASIYMAVVR